jgi:hypothetical protein
MTYVENPDGSRTAVTIADRIVETVGAGLFLHDAAAAIGFPVDTLRAWRKIGARVARQLLNGEKRLNDLSAHERQCGDLSIRWDRAEMGARQALLNVGMKLAKGGLTRTEVSVKTIRPAANEPGDGERLVETVTRDIEVLPSVQMLSWLLERRWPEDFGRRRLEVTGADGGPVLLGDAASAADKLRSAIEDIRESKAEADESLAGNGNGAHV